MEKVGKDGVITVEEAKGTETNLEVVEGMQFDHGYLSPYFVTKPERMEAIGEQAARHAQCRGHVVLKTPKMRRYEVNPFSAWTVGVS